MYKFLFFFVLCLYPFQVCADSIEDYCRGLMGESYSLILSCVKQEKAAKAVIENKKLIEPAIYSYCKKLVGDSWSVTKSCIDQEKKARNSVRGGKFDPKIKEYCKELVGESWALTESCIKQETKAKKELGM